MPVQRRERMPKLPPFALAEAPEQKQAYWPYLLLIFGLASASLIALHIQLLTLPFFWDELGQFIPAALDLLRTGALIPHSAVPNVHPPGTETYLVLWYKLFGYSIPVTRVAMLVLAGAGLTLTFLLAIELSRDAAGAPAFLPPLFLLVSPLFYMQSMMAQLDMPAMVLTVLALLLFVRQNYLGAASASVVLVLVKETGLIAPAVFALVLLRRHDWKHAAWFAAAPVVLGAWLIFLHNRTGNWLGDPGFAHYNVVYSLEPVRALFCLSKRLYYLFLAEFRWIGTLVLLFTALRKSTFWTPEWRVTLAVGGATLVLVSVLGGAELERYLLPVLPIFYIAVSVGTTMLPRLVGITATLAMMAGLVVNLFWNPPYPFPYENNYAMVDFVRLQQAAAQFADRELRGGPIATAWPFTAALRRPDYGYVEHKLKTVETSDFHARSIDALHPASFDSLITYTRTWEPVRGVTSVPWVQSFLRRFYQWEPAISRQECEARGLEQVASWEMGGQVIAIYVRRSKLMGPRGTHRVSSFISSTAQ
jgi:hypothetical protein